MIKHFSVHSPQAAWWQTAVVMQHWHLMSTSLYFRRRGKVQKTRVKSRGFLFDCSYSMHGVCCWMQFAHCCNVNKRVAMGTISRKIPKGNPIDAVTWGFASSAFSLGLSVSYSLPRQRRHCSFLSVLQLFHIYFNKLPTQQNLDWLCGHSCLEVQVETRFSFSWAGCSWAASMSAGIAATQWREL